MAMNLSMGQIMSTQIRILDKCQNFYILFNPVSNDLKSLTVLEMEKVLQHFAVKDVLNSSGEKVTRVEF